MARGVSDDDDDESPGVVRHRIKLRLDRGVRLATELRHLLASLEDDLWTLFTGTKGRRKKQGQRRIAKALGIPADEKLRLQAIAMTLANVRAALDTPRREKWESIRRTLEN